MDNNDNNDGDAVHVNEQQPQVDGDGDGDGDDEQATRQRRRLQRLEVISILQQYDEFPTLTRDNTIDGLVENFIETTGEAIHDLLCDNIDPNSEEYRGLDVDRDTEVEVETAIRFFPEILSRRSRGGGRDYHPVKCLANGYYGAAWRFNLKAVSFLPLLVKLAIEFGTFDEELRGGLLTDDEAGDKVLVLLTVSDRDFENKNEAENREYNELIDDKLLLVMKQLRKMGVLKKEDIQRRCLLEELCHQRVFAKKRFRFLAEWDPVALTKSDDYGYSPLHYAAENGNSIQGFQSVLEYGIRYYPNKKGISLLFKGGNKTVTGPKFPKDTPFQLACKKFGREEVTNAIEDTITHYYYSDDTPALDIFEALIAAAIDEDIHLDCVYFLMRRQPDVLLKVLPQLSSSRSSLSQSPASSSAYAATESNDNVNNNKKKKKKNDDELLMSSSITVVNPKKRKRNKDDIDNNNKNHQR
jgi:hypothetical protein